MKFIEALNKNGRAYEHVNNPLVTAKYVMSVQASAHHYCSPRKHVPLEEYTNFEVGILDTNGDWLSEHKFRKFMQLFDSDMRAELMRCKLEDTSIFAWLPKEIVEKVYNTLRRAKV